MNIFQQKFGSNTYIRLVFLIFVVVLGFQAIDFGLLYEFEEEARSINLAEKQYTLVSGIQEQVLNSKQESLPRRVADDIALAFTYHKALQFGNVEMDITPINDTESNAILERGEPYIEAIAKEAKALTTGASSIPQLQNALIANGDQYLTLTKQLTQRLNQHNTGNLRQAENVQAFTILIMLFMIVLSYFVLFRPYTRGIKRQLSISTHRRQLMLSANNLLESKLEEIKQKNEELAAIDRELKQSLDQQQLINKELNDSFLQVYRQKNQLDTAQQMAKIGYWSYDLKDSIIWSEQMYHIFEVEQEAGTTGPNVNQFADRLHPEDKNLVFEKLKDVSNGKTVRYRHRIISPSGEVKTILSNIRPEFGYNQENIIGVFGVTQDITAMVKREQKIEQINQDQENILHIIAHDVRSPLNKLYTLLEIISTHPTTEAERARYLELASEEYQGAIKLVEEMLESFSMKQQAEKKFINLPQMVMSQLDRSEQSFENKGVELKRDICSGFEDWVYPNRMQRVLENLLSNALKFTPQGGSVAVRLATEKTCWTLSVSDSGIGIPIELQENLFEKFNKKIRRKGLNGEKSTGLGMSIIKEIVELHGGKISLKSAKWEGTTINICIPFTRETHAPPPKPSLAASITPKIQPSPPVETSPT